jgi:hypothetical protein
VPAERESAVDATVIGSVTVAVCGVGDKESVTLNVTLAADCAAVGVPVIQPVLLKLNPGGRVPALIDHVYGWTPALAVRQLL